MFAGFIDSFWLVAYRRVHLNGTYLALYDAASISICRANLARGIKNGSTSAPPDVLPLPLLPPPFAAEVLDGDEAG